MIFSSFFWVGGDGEQFPLLKQKTGVTEEHMRDIGSGFPGGGACFLAGCYRSAHSDRPLIPTSGGV